MTDNPNEYLLSLRPHSVRLGPRSPTYTDCSRVFVGCWSREPTAKVPLARWRPQRYARLITGLESITPSTLETPSKTCRAPRRQFSSTACPLWSLANVATHAIPASGWCEIRTESRLSVEYGHRQCVAKMITARPDLLRAQRHAVGASASTNEKC